MDLCRAFWYEHFNEIISSEYVIASFSNSSTDSSFSNSILM